MNAPVNPVILEFAREELAGKLLHTLVACLGTQKLAWSMMSEKNQEIALNKMRENIDKAVRDAVMVISTERQPAIRITVGKVTFEDDGIKAQMSLSRSDEGRHDLADATGTSAYVILARPESYTGGMTKVEASKDQKALPLDTDYEVKQEPGYDTWGVFLKGEPIVGGKGFMSQQDAEKYLQGLLGVGKKKDAEKPADPAPAADPKPEAKGNGKKKNKGTEPAAGTTQGEAGAPPTEQSQAPASTSPVPTLAEMEQAFHDGALDAAKAEADWDKTWEEIAAKFPVALVDEYYTELSRKFAAGWDKGKGDE
jgi:hypothetical protein